MKNVEEKSISVSIRIPIRRKLPENSPYTTALQATYIQIQNHAHCCYNILSWLRASETAIENFNNLDGRKRVGKEGGRKRTNRAAFHNYIIDGYHSKKQPFKLLVYSKQCGQWITSLAAYNHIIL